MNTIKNDLEMDFTILSKLLNENHTSLNTRKCYYTKIGDNGLAKKKFPKTARIKDCLISNE